MDPWEVTFILLIGPTERAFKIVPYRESILLSALDCKSFTQHQERPLRVVRMLPHKPLITHQTFILWFQMVFFGLLKLLGINIVLLFILFCSATA